MFCSFEETRGELNLALKDNYLNYEIPIQIKIKNESETFLPKDSKIEIFNNNIKIREENIDLSSIPPSQVLPIDHNFKLHFGGLAENEYHFIFKLKSKQNRNNFCKNSFQLAVTVSKLNIYDKSKEYNDIYNSNNSKNNNKSINNSSSSFSSRIISKGTENVQSTNDINEQNEIIGKRPINELKIEINSEEKEDKEDKDKIYNILEKLKNDFPKIENSFDREVLIDVIKAKKYDYKKIKENFSIFLRIDN